MCDILAILQDESTCAGVRRKAQGTGIGHLEFAIGNWTFDIEMSYSVSAFFSGFVGSPNN